MNKIKGNLTKIFLSQDKKKKMKFSHNFPSAFFVGLKKESIFATAIEVKADQQTTIFKVLQI